MERAHIDDEVIVTEGGATLGDEEALAAEGAHFSGDVDGIERGEELAFFDVDGAAGLGGGFEQIRLAAEEGGDLQEIDVFGCDVRLVSGVDVRGDGDTEFLADFSEDAAAVFHAGTTEGADGGAVCLIEGGFENEVDAGAIGDFLEGASHFPSEGFGLQGAGAEDEKRDGPAYGDAANLKGIEGHGSGEKSALLEGGLVERAEVIEGGAEEFRFGRGEISGGFGGEHFKGIHHGFGGAEIDFLVAGDGIRDLAEK